MDRSLAPDPDAEIKTRWRIFATTVSDPNPANDRVTLVFVTRAAIPTLSTTGLFAMTLFLAVAALVLQRRRLQH